MAREMKDSGIEWIGMIPSTWSRCEIKHYCIDIFPGATPQSTNPDYWDGDINWIPSGSCHDCRIYTAPKKISQAGYDNSSTKLIPAKTALVAMTGATCGNTGYLMIESCANQSVTAFIEDKTRCDSVFLWYILRAAKDHLLTFQSGGAQGGVNVENCKNIVVPFVPLDEQRSIAAFLDRKCSEIDSVIANTQQTLDEYRKLRKAIITKAITKGVRSERVMKDSGSVWFGEIPAEWSMVRLKYMFHIKKDIAGKEGYTVLSITQRGITPKNIESNEGQLAADYSKYQLVEPGDFAMNHMDLLTGWVDISKYDGVTSPDYRVFVLDDEASNKEYYLYMMQMCYFNRIFYGLGQGVSGMGRWRLQADKFLNFYIAVPPAEEQDEIVEALKKQLSEMDALIAAKEQLLIEMESYKKSVIYEYVTGKKEVPACQ